MKQTEKVYHFSLKSTPDIMVLCKICINIKNYSPEIFVCHRLKAWVRGESTNKKRLGLGKKQPFLSLYYYPKVRRYDSILL